MDLIETHGVPFILKGTPYEAPHVRQLFEVFRLFDWSYYPEGFCWYNWDIHNIPPMGPVRPLPDAVRETAGWEARYTGHTYVNFAHQAYEEPLDPYARTSRGQGGSRRS